MKLARTEIAELLAELRDLSTDDRVARLRLVDTSGDVLLDLAEEASRLTTKSADEAMSAAAEAKGLDWSELRPQLKKADRWHVETY